MFKKVEHCRDQIIVIRPVYGEQGDVTEIYTRSGEVFIDRRGIKAVRRALARSWAVDLIAQRKQLKTMLGRELLLPIYLDKQVLIPLKMRRVVAERDCAHGFVDVESIASIDEREGMIYITLLDEREIQLFCTTATARESQHCGLKVLEWLEPPEKEEEEMVVEALRYLLKRLGRIESRLEQLAGPECG